MLNPHRILLVFLSIGACLSLRAQGDYLQRPVTFHYNKVPLGAALEDIGKRYKVRFAYSEDFIPVDLPLSGRVQDEPLVSALDILFLETQIIYRPIGKQIVLKIDPSKNPPPLSQVEPPVEVAPEIILPAEEATVEVATVPEPAPDTTQQQPSRRAPVNVPAPVSVPRAVTVSNDEPKYKGLSLGVDWESVNARMDNNRSVAQVSLLPFVSSHLLDAPKKINHVSLNILWGHNGGVEGVEIGGLVNSVRGDVRGAQIAGLVNVAKGGLYGAQVAGLSNAARDGFDGIQVAGLLNKAGGETKGAQIAGIANKAQNGSKMQIGGISNRAGGNSGLQVAGLWNSARNVKAQIGLMNWADSSSVSIGLLNFVRHGYNRIAFSFNETFTYNFDVRFGTRPFYNIVYAAARRDEVELAGNDPDKLWSFALGYGLGTAIRLGNRRLLNLEVVGAHVSEYEQWQDQLNLLGQGRILIDWNFSKKFALAGGVTFNLLASKQRDADGNLTGSPLIEEPELMEVNNGINYQGWIGYSIGFRF